MPHRSQQRRWFWVTLALSSISIVAVVFAIWELVESHFFRDVDYLTLHYLYVSRGVVSSLLLAFWAAWFVLRERQAAEKQLRRSHARYRKLLQVDPSAMALCDPSLRVLEWNAAAERLFGFSAEEVLGASLPTVPDEKKEELQGFLERVSAGAAILDVETLRRNRDGVKIEVLLSLLPFHEDSGETCVLEVTNDIRERVRFRETLLQIEKLTTMGQMAAGTAHHLNTPLAAMLLRMAMVRGRAPRDLAPDLEQLEGNIRFCQQFVRRLLDFSRRAPAHKQPEPLGSTVESVLSFLAPQVLAKRARLHVDVSAANGAKVLADRNQLEALFLILVSNSLDAVPDSGHIDVRCRLLPECVQVEVTDDGCGIAPEHRTRIFEPFFTTKPAGKGTGLGLAIARNIVNEHGGSVRLESGPGQGTTAIVELPLWVESGVPQGVHA
jgi:PAS domain S-box-containing protein